MPAPSSTEPRSWMYPLQSCQHRSLPNPGPRCTHCSHASTILPRTQVLDVPTAVIPLPNPGPGCTHCSHASTVLYRTQVLDVPTAVMPAPSSPEPRSWMYPLQSCQHRPPLNPGPGCTHCSHASTIFYRTQVLDVPTAVMPAPFSTEPRSWMYPLQSCQHRPPLNPGPGCTHCSHASTILYRTQVLDVPTAVIPAPFSTEPRS